MGLIGAYVGGTADQLWQSPDAIKSRMGPNKWNWPANYKASFLWNAFIVPLLRTVHSGAIWYQVGSLLLPSKALPLPWPPL